MSDTTVNYADNRIDAGGDRAFDSSAYGTTTGDLQEGAKAPSGDFGSGLDQTQQATRISGAPSEQPHTANAGTTGSTTSTTQSTGAENLSTEQARVAQGYTRGGPDVGA
ncbi:hypothetical protein PYCC9005_005290 [Savitreella phatthalungensis]